MRTLIYALLVCHTMVQGRNGTPKDRKGKAMRNGRNALPQRDKNSDKFDGFDTYDEAKEWVEAEVERTYALYSQITFDDDLYDDLSGVLIDESSKLIVDGTIIHGRTALKTRAKVFLSLTHATYMSDSDDIKFPNDDEYWGKDFVKYSIKVEGYPDHQYTATITVKFKKDGRIKEAIYETPDGHLSTILEQAKQIASAAFKVTDFFGNIAKSVNMEDVYLQYVVYIFFIILFGMAIIVILLTAVCVKVVLLGENKTKLYKQVPATDTEL